MKGIRVLLPLFTLSALGVSSGVLAHHSFAAEFSRDLPVEVTGTVTRVDWTNPHARFYIDAKDDKGQTVAWNFELTTPNVLMRRGWAKDTLKTGDQVTVNGFRARNDPHVGNASSVKLSDGRQLFTGQNDGTATNNN